MSVPPYDPYSPNALFSQILERLDQQDSTQENFRLEIRESFKELRNDLTVTKDRVSDLERESWKNRGVVAGIALAVSAVWHLFTANKTS